MKKRDKGWFTPGGGQLDIFTDVSYHLTHMVYFYIIYFVALDNIYIDDPPLKRRLVYETKEACVVASIYRYRAGISICIF